MCTRDGQSETRPALTITKGMFEETHSGFNLRGSTASYLYPIDGWSVHFSDELTGNRRPPLDE